MVFLKKLELYGFKTFAKKTSITFERGLNVIMGPNGSGKSNLIDAVQFILGELSVRNLRATSFASLLFSGNEEVPKAKYAWVAVHFDNSDRRIPIDTDVVVISRHIASDGTSVYRVNGKRYSRSNLIDILNVASLTGSTNIVFQGTTMRIAEYSPEDRRRSIESLIGIADYDRKKEEAMVELREAETNLKVATGRYEEVRKRLLELERERNELLCYNFIVRNLNQLRALKLAGRFARLLEQQRRLESEIARCSSKITELRAQKERLEEAKRTKEKEWRELTERVMEKGGDRLVSIQREIGDITSRIAALKTTLTTARSTIHTYENMAAAKGETLASIRNQIIAAKKEIKELSKTRQRLAEQIGEKVKIRDGILSRIEEIKNRAEENASRLAKVEEEIAQLESEHARLELKIRGDREAAEILREQLETVESKRASFAELLEGFQSKLKELNALKVKEHKRLETLTRTIEKIRRYQETAEAEIKNAEKMSKGARISLTEFKSKKRLAENLLSEEKALEFVENLARLGGLRGVIGRLDDHVKVNPNYRRAVEAAAEGWLKALLVEDMGVVRRCAESLKRSKVGRIKLLPLTSLRSVKPIPKPDLAGIIGPAASFVDCPARFRPAVNFVLGDTLIASGNEAALEASERGFRVVTIDGELYEPGLKLKVGFYREPIELAEIVPNEATIKKFGDTVASFETVLEKRRMELKRIHEEIVKLEVEKALQSDTIKFFEHEAQNLKQQVERIRKDVTLLERRSAVIKNKLEATQAREASSESAKSEIEARIHRLRVDAAHLRRKIRPETVTQLESDNAMLESEINSLQRQLSEAGSRSLSLESNVQNAFVPAFRSAREELQQIHRNISRLRREAEAAAGELDGLNAKLKALEDEKNSLYQAMSAKKDETKRFTEEINALNTQIARLESELEPLASQLDRLRQEAWKIQFELDHTASEFDKLSGGKPLEAVSGDFDPSKMPLVEATIHKLEAEFELLHRRINMQAADLYEPARSNYKELSVRINQLEEEKREILRFMETVEREKREAFLRALERVNQKFSETFHAITNGSGWLQLHNPDDPFSGGIDIIVEFPGKPPMPVTAASGGEKSVVAVCYIFAMQTISTTSPFYVFDEIDAHLDPLNVQRLAELLAKESKNSQIIVVTFKEAVAAKGDRVFGIYGRNGISYVYSMPPIPAGAAS